MPTTARNPSRSWLVPATVLAVAAALVAVVVVTNRPPPDDGAPQVAPVGAGAADDPAFFEAESRDTSDKLAVGPVDAPVVLVVFSDYQCPFCARWNEQTLPAMMEHVEAGDLRIEWRDVNVFGPASERAARASYAAAQQDQFLTYHNALFQDGERRTEAELTDEALVELAGSLGLDTTTFAADLDSPETASVISAYQQFGLDLGATSTPVFVLGGQPFVGAQPTEVFEQAFQAALDSAR